MIKTNENGRVRIDRVRYVYVIDIDGNPLMPTKQCNKVRWLLKTKRAKVIYHEPFTIQLKYVTATHIVDELTLGNDTGYEHAGFSVTSARREYYSEELRIDNSMKDRMDDRRMLRRNRRNRKTRYRPSKWSNRTHSKKEWWLPPTTNHRMNAHLRRVEFIKSILPIKYVCVELAEFDTQKMENPDIFSREYQNGEQKGFDTVKDYIRSRDHYTCQCCHGDTGDKRLEVHHIQWRSHGGTNSPDNLVLLCKTCHDNVHSYRISLDDKITEQIRKQNLKYTSVSTMNKQYIEKLKEIFGSENVKVTYGYITACNRKKHNIGKSHVDDAFVIAGNFNAERLDYHFLTIQVRRHNRLLHVQQYSKGGKRRSMNAPDNFKNSKFRKYDKVIVNGRTGFITGSSNGYAIVKDIFGNKLIKSKITVKKLKLLHHKHQSFIIDKVKYTEQ